MNSQFPFAWSSPDDVFSSLPKNGRIVVSMAAAEPTLFFDTLSRRYNELCNVEVICANPMKEYSCFMDSDVGKYVSLKTLFFTSLLRAGSLHSHVQYVPQHLSQWSKNMMSSGPIDVFWGSCSVPDEKGFVSLGIGACYEPEIFNSARFVVLEVNPLMPRTAGATLVPMSRVHAWISNSHALSGLQECVPTEVDVRIAEFVSEYVTDGTCLQLGIGAIPNALGGLLKGRTDLGVHTELITDCVVTLYEQGAINGRKKQIWPDKIVGSFVLGTQRLYDFVNNHAAVELHPSSLVNRPSLIAKNPKALSINSAIEVDITGQVCSESVGHREISGTGGAAETHIGAQLSQGGRAIIALPSQTKSGKSKIVSELTRGAKVTISRNDVDTVVTEYGVAQLRGKTVRQRVLELVNIAHPDVRDTLLSDARVFGYL